MKVVPRGGFSKRLYLDRSSVTTAFILIARGKVEQMMQVRVSQERGLRMNLHWDATRASQNKSPRNIHLHKSNYNIPPSRKLNYILSILLYS